MRFKKLPTMKKPSFEWLTWQQKYKSIDNSNDEDIRWSEKRYTKQNQSSKFLISALTVSNLISLGFWINTLIYNAGQDQRGSCNERMLERNAALMEVSHYCKFSSYHIVH